MTAVSEFLSGLDQKPNVVDLGCGDFNVGQQLRSFCNQYTACDVVPQLIEFNQNKFQDLAVDFRVLDFVTGELPPGDVVFIRQVLQHLSNDHIAQVVEKLAGQYRWLVLTESVPKGNSFIPNIDKPAGRNIRLDIAHSGIVLTAHPFNLQVKSQRKLCEIPEYNGCVRTILYEL